MGKRKGFTFIEISLFLAVTAALFIGVALGVRNSIFQQQYYDATQNFFEFMRSVYSEVSNPQSVGAGNSNYAIYGKMIVFGETVDLLGEAVPSNEQQIFVYDVVGSATAVGTGDVKNLLKGASVSPVFVNRNIYNTVSGIEFASPEKYTTKWDAGIETTDRAKMQRSILVVRHPRSGTINTLVLNEAIQVNQMVVQARNTCMGKTDCAVASTMLTNKIDAFSTFEQDLCVNPYGFVKGSGVPRRDIRILENARNASSVELIDLDSTDNRCQ